jgi:hypothetical protein
MKKVEVYELKDPADKKLYETLLNDPTVEIIKDVFAYDRNGVPKITVWFEKIE